MLKLPASWVRVNADARRARRASVRTRTVVHGGAVPDPLESARLAGLRYVNDETAPGIRRLGSARFRYVDSTGGTVADAAVLARIRALAIPPAWTRVWISTAPNAHVLATGRDARGRKQYRYHLDWRRIRDEVKYGRLIAFSEALPKIRQKTDADLRRHGLPREKVLAAVVQLLEKTLIRVGNEEYARENGSIGLTTMKDGHARIAAGSVRFEFRGKSGIRHAIALNDRRLARIIKACRDLPGYELFQYLDRKGRRQVIDSGDVNTYLREISGHDYSAKDFRTWAGTVLAAQALAAVKTFSSNAQAKRNVIAAIESVAKRLGNTRSVCRKCYIHPAILDAYMDGATIATLRGRAAGVTKSGGLSAEESAVVAMIERRLAAQSTPSRAAGRSVSTPRRQRKTAGAKALRDPIRDS